jgi:hypothetical protein
MGLEVGSGGCLGRGKGVMIWMIDGVWVRERIFMDWAMECRLLDLCD